MWVSLRNAGLFNWHTPLIRCLSQFALDSFRPRQTLPGRNFKPKQGVNMSWIIGTNCQTPEGPDIAKHCPDKPLFTLEHGGYTLCAGGNPRTCWRGTLPRGEGYLVLGAPAVLRGDTYSALTEEAANAILPNEERLRGLDGHYLILIFGEDGIRIYNDPLGKRSLYIRQSAKDVFFTSSLAILKAALRPELDFRALGVYWHTMFPPSNDRYAPADAGYFKDVRVLGTGGKAVLGAAVRIESRLFKPAKEKRDIYSLLRSFCLLPLSQAARIAVSLSGGMDIRPLLAVYLGAGAEISAIHYGNDDSSDFRIAQRISAQFRIPFRHISYETAEGSDPWAQAVEFKRKWGVTAPPANAPYLGYYHEVAKDCDFYVSGYFGELFRFRFFVAHLASLFKGKKPGVADLSAYLYRNPARVFIPEVNRELQLGYGESIQRAFTQMPSPTTMGNPKWFNLFLARYSPFTVNMPALAELDCLLVDHMPWLQSGIIAQHWQLGFGFQLAEGVHRGLIRRNCPQLAQFPLALADVQAPYFYRQYMLKLKMWQYYRRRPLTRESRADRFLAINRESILDLFHSDRVRDYAPYDRTSLEASLAAYYQGDMGQRDALMCWLAVELGR